MAKYVVTFDLVSPDAGDYDTIRQMVERNFNRWCHLVTTTYVLISDMPTGRIRDLFLSALQGNTKMHVFVGKFVEHSFSLDEEAGNYLNRHL